MCCNSVKTCRRAEIFSGKIINIVKFQNTRKNEKMILAK